MKRVATVIVSLVIVVLFGGCDWTQLGFDGTHSGLNPTERAIRVGNVALLQSAWVFSDPNVGESRLAVSGGRVFASAPLGQITGTPPNVVFPPPSLHVLDDKAGTVDWTAGGQAIIQCLNIGETSAYMGAPAVTAGRVYLLSSSTFCVLGGAGEHVYSSSSLDAVTGASTPFGNINVQSDPVVSSDGTVFVAGSPGVSSGVRSRSRRLAAPVSVRRRSGFAWCTWSPATATSTPLTWRRRSCDGVPRWVSGRATFRRRRLSTAACMWHATT
jgi:hypothetical protein